MTVHLKAKLTLSLLLALFIHTGVTYGQVAVEQQVAASAQMAVQNLGNELMQGNFSYGYERIYPRWKRRLAKRYGGADKLDSQIQKGNAQKRDLKVIVSSYKAQQPTSFFSVWRSKKIDNNTGKPIINHLGQNMVVEHWLAIVPTITRIKIPVADVPGSIREIEEKSYTIAISEKGSHDWHFMTGLRPTVQDLRSLFPTLPATENELGLPVSAVREIK